MPIHLTVTPLIRLKSDFLKYRLAFLLSYNVQGLEIKILAFDIARSLYFHCMYCKKKIVIIYILPGEAERLPVTCSSLEGL